MWLSLLAGFSYLWRRYALQAAAVRRLEESLQEETATVRRERGWFAMWLYRAGFRHRRAPFLFLLSTFIGIVAGAIVSFAFVSSGLVELLVAILSSVPGAVGEVFLPLVWALPWVGGLFLAGLPALVVQTTRKRRVTMIEQDLPIFLDLLSTLAEAGLGFDSALDRILGAQPPSRPLVQEFRLFQIDVLAGRGRIPALRQLGQRVDVTWFSILVAALVHAEQVGTGLSETLKIQAEDLRQRRRERALAFSMAMPVRLLPALVICFLPGLMVAAIAPIGYQIVEVLDQFIRRPLGG